MGYLANEIVATEGSTSRVERLAKLELEYLFDESFQRRGAEVELLSDPPVADDVDSPLWKPDKQVPAHITRLCERRLLSPDEERHRFRRMNYAKYRADILRRQLDPANPDWPLVQRIEALIDLALRDRNEIVSANTRLVISIAKKLVGVMKTFDELLSEGLETLLRATDKYDYSRGYRFSTYVTTAVRRTLWRSLQIAQRDRDRFVPDPKALREHAQPQDAEPVNNQQQQQRSVVLMRLLRHLSERERLILSRRYGLDDGAEQTLQSLARDLGVCKERVRQLEARAKEKIRSLAEEQQLALDEGNA